MTDRHVTTEKGLHRRYRNRCAQACANGPEKRNCRYTQASGFAPELLRPPEVRRLKSPPNVPICKLCRAVDYQLAYRIADFLRQPASGKRI